MMMMIGKGRSVRLSVCPSNTLMIYAYVVQDIEIHIVLQDRTTCLVSFLQISYS